MDESGRWLWNAIMLSVAAAIAAYYLVWLFNAEAECEARGGVLVRQAVGQPVCVEER